MDNIIIIPAYNPDNILIQLVDEIIDKVSKRLIVINDGSEEKYNDIFEKVKTKVELLENDKNMGKGYSLKKGLKYIQENLNIDIIGVITVDADGQHCVKDIETIYKKMKENYKEGKEKIILGSRNLNVQGIPIKNKLGNKISSYILKKKMKIWIKDTQTGLRGIPIKYIKQFINIEGNRYEYEQNMLIYSIKNKIAFEEIEIKAIYNKNKSNFNVILDSYKVIQAILKR